MGSKVLLWMVCCALLVPGCAPEVPGRALASELGTRSAALSPWRRTVVFIEGETNPGQDMFVRGGVDHDFANRVLGRDCSADNLECAIPIRHRNRRNTNTWHLRDTHLDWYGAEPEQAEWPYPAEGSPLAWITILPW